MSGRGRGRAGAGARSSTERVAATRMMVELEAFERLSSKRILVVLDAKRESELPELLFQKKYKTTGKRGVEIEVHANHEQSHFFSVQLKGFTKEYADRCVLQLSGLTMPGVTVMGLEDIDSSDGEESATEEDQVEASTGKRKRVTRQPSAKGVITRSKKAARESEALQQEDKSESEAVTYCENKIKSLELEDTVWENEFCDMTSLIASKHFIAHTDHDEKVEEVLDHILSTGQSFVLDLTKNSEENSKLMKIFDDSRLKKRCYDLDQAFGLLSLNDFEAFRKLGSSARKPTSPKIQSTFYEGRYLTPKAPNECFSYVNGMTPPEVFSHVHVIRNVGHFVGFDVMDKLIQFVKDPSKDTNFAGKSKDVKGLDPKTVTAEAPTVHFCFFANLHSAIQCQPHVLQKFICANYDTIVWFGSGAELCQQPSSQSPTGTYNETMDRTQRDSVFAWVTKKLLLDRSVTCYPPMELITFFHDR